MSITVGLSGIAGWRALQNSESRQIAAISANSQVRSLIDYFRDNISSVASSDDIVGDYRLLKVALGAYGLEADLPNKAFIRKVLESDIADDKSFVNRLSDKRYLRMARAFNLGGESWTAISNATVDQVADSYIKRQYETRVGEGDESLRLALNARRELESFVGRNSSDRTLWYEVLGNPPLRKVFEGAFGFGPAYGKLPVDRQLNEYMKAADRFLGNTSFKTLSTDAGIDKVITNFLARSQMMTGATGQNRYSAALALLSR